MEKIQKALEKSLLSRGQQPPSVRPVPVAPRRPADRPAIADTESSAIAYTRTRVAPVSDKEMEKRRLVAGLSTHDQSDTFRILRTRVLNRMEEKGYRTLGIVSSVGQEGKSLVASNLALSLASILTKTVLLVDLDLRAPSVHTYFGIDPEPGLLGYLRDGRALSSCLVNPGINRLVLLPNGRPVRSSAELLTMPRMLGLSKELRETYADRIIIYDLPPLLHTDDALAFMQHIDCFLLVTSEGHTKEHELKQAVSLMKGYPLIGTVMNRSSETSKHVKKSRMTRQNRP
ncbi:CpsD/CapB family tyrosine-protein kinase [Roseospira marina]|uniref:CpsD/CapB family tyrosine-protein kinase n=1 Tax=Roseospira marina TaxID=140057 RepID=A0A5M6IG04_9PROT|nr:CpsD/CapB family tyrosine-protein kinase [Roseospira marina]KAA5606508.1 CpsD/CapB family tyrosine-protein kinase [Roseospira marina]MBB4314069.1 Mrp family chromosome partitioning ATPase [Roseospira marina]MBB5087230.1 Mrp family chromosome partitioning ATPase [Roseospira marina]